MIKKLIRKMIVVLLSMPKTLYFNIITFGITGIRLPVFISYNTKMSRIKRNTVEIDTSPSLFMITFGYGGSEGVIPNRYSEIYLDKGSKLIFRGKAQFAEGCSIRNEGILDIGHDTSMNRNGFISCRENIRIGDNTLIGWNVNIRDSDGHKIVKSGESKSVSAPVYVGNKVWICSYVDILKGSYVSDSSVIAYRSLVNKSFHEQNALLAGHPAKKILSDIDWIY